MKSLFLYIKSLDLQKLLLVSFFLFGIYPLIPSRLEPIIVILFSGIALLFFFKNYKTRQKFKVNFFITTSIFLVLLLSAILSEDVKSAFKKVESMVSLLVMPLIFYIFLANKTIDFTRNKNLFLKVFFTANVVYCLVLIGYFSVYTNPTYPNKDVNFFRNALEDIPLIGEHPIYGSIFLSIAILIGFTQYKSGKNNRKNNSLIALGHLILLAILFILMSKGVIIALFFSTSILLLTKIKTKPIYPVILVGFVVLLFLIPSNNNRFSELFNKNSYKTLEISNSTSVRVHILKCVTGLISKNPIYGYGLGDVQKKLDNCYESENYNFPLNKFNSHNQYLFIWLSSGIFGFLIFILFLSYYFKVVITNKDYLMLSILVLYCIVFLFENVLSRQSGVILFSFLINFLAIENSKVRRLSD
ncbi:MAG: O-antigen ligase family protein [Flavobacteriaceae bacterium]|nr:O-antigen ligase family protein [Flavobacteriaceae bacterium]